MVLSDDGQRDDRDEPEAEVSGRAVRTIVTCVGRDAAATERSPAALLAEQGLPRKPDPGAWYPLAGCLRVVDSVLIARGSATVERIGEGLVGIVEWPAPLETVPETMETLGAHYERTHRGDAGTVAFERTGATTGRVRCGTPYPCPLERGIVRGLARRIGTGLVTVTEVGHCRREGADSCTYELSW